MASAVATLGSQFHFHGGTFIRVGRLQYDSANRWFARVLINKKQGTIPCFFNKGHANFDQLQ